MAGASPHPEPEDERRQADHRRRSITRRLLTRGPRSEERLIRFMEDRRREFAEQTGRFERTLAELEQRELLLGDAKASIERLLRLGSKELDAREADIVRLMDELTERDARVRAQEEELARRTSELGAVELKRLVLEQRERALEAREARQEEVAETPVEPVEPEVLDTADSNDTADTATVAFVPGASYRLVEIDPLSSEAGRRVAIDGEEYEVLRVGPSPLPGDDRLCAYLVRGPRAWTSSVGSS